jgi:polysaccharide pyruvyl transferase CsaB
VFVQEARELGIRTEVLPGKNLFRILRQIEAMIHKDGYDLIHCHGARGNLMGAMLSHRVKLPTVSTVHSDYRLDYLGRPFSRLTYGVINSIALRLLDFRIGVSDAMVDLLISRGFNPERLFSIYNGLDVTPRPVAMTREAFFHSVGLEADDSCVVVGIAARLNPVKDIATLIRAFAKAYASANSLRLLIAGDGAERDMLCRLAKELGVSHAVCFAGWIEDTDTFYRSIDINTLTSLSETFPYALTEGARAALPTISSHVGGVPYLIDHGVNGFLFPVGDTDALASNLITLANNPQLRKQLGTRLFEKAKKEYSLEVTVSRQLEIYQKMLSWKKREEILICGAYGKGNAGDDAILLAILSELRTLNPDFSFHVLSRNPKETRLNYRVNALYTFHFPKIVRRMRHAALYINGGGSLMQDITSWRSLWFYLWTLRAAKRRGCCVLMYGCGIGPIHSPKNRLLAARTIEKYVDAITLRDPHSLQELKDMRVSAPEISLSSDPTVTLRAAAPEIIDSVFQNQNLDPNGNYIAFIVRPWIGFDDKVSEFAAAAAYAYQTYGLIPIFFPIEPRLDISAAKKITALLTIPHHLFSDHYSAEQTIGFLSRMQTVVSMRLHGLIFSAGQGVPLIGVVYDPKVSSFLSYIGQNLYLNLEDLTASMLQEQIDIAVSRGTDRAFLSERVTRLRQVESKNSLTAAKLLGLVEPPSP